MMKMIGKWVIAMLLLCSIATTVSANVSAERTYFEEETSIPFETWVILFAGGILFLVLAAITGFSGSGGLTLVFGIVSTLFLSASAFATPVTGFYSYITNSSTNATSSVTPLVWGAFQPWMAWFCWGLATIAFILFVFGVLILFKDLKDQKEHDENMDWI